MQLTEIKSKIKSQIMRLGEATNTTIIALIYLSIPVFYFYIIKKTSDFVDKKHPCTKITKIR